MAAKRPAGFFVHLPVRFHWALTPQILQFRLDGTDSILTIKQILTGSLVMSQNPEGFITDTLTDAAGVSVLVTGREAERMICRVPHQSVEGHVYVSHNRTLSELLARQGMMLLPGEVVE